MKLHFQTLFVAIGLGIKRNGHIFAAILLGILFGNWIHNHPDKIPSKIAAKMWPLRFIPKPIATNNV